jgi:transcriptional regulator with XRE-family HTH domain
MREHGTKACYVFGPEPGGDRSKGCRCTACARANRDAENNRNRLIAYGRWQPYVDAGPAREHLRMLAASGIGWKRAAELSGVSHGAMSKLLYGGPGDRPPSRRVRPETEAAILAVRPSLTLLAGSAATDATGTRRRVRALVAAGWSQAKIAARLGVGQGNFNAMMRRERVAASTARAVTALYEELWDKAPPESSHRDKIAASRARRYAAQRGWALPMAWDDIDDPRAVPAEGWRRDGGELRGRSLAAEGRDLEALGLSRNEAARRLGVSRGTLGQAMRRYPGEAAA